MVQNVRASDPGITSSGSYDLVLELGKGGMGTAHLARSVGAGGFERLVVVKRLHPHLLDRMDAVARFLDEARLASFVRHANVVSTLHVGEDEAGYYLVLEYVEGASLEELIDRAALRGENLPPPIVLRIALDALSGLSATHNARDVAGRRLELLHRDVSLQNILIGRDGVARLADFGIAKSALGSVHTDQGYVLGKLLYMPPEYLRHEGTGPDLDVYSLGVTLWMTLAGRSPWPDADDVQMVTHVLEDGIPPLSSVVKVPPQIEAVIREATCSDRLDRFPTARAMAERIEAISRETGWVSTHAEVADLMERLAGVDLERRRELVAKRLAEGSGTQRLEVLPPREEVTSIPLVRNRPPTDETDLSPILRRRRLTPYVVVASIAAATLGGFAAFRAFAGSAGPTVATTPEPAQTQSGAGAQPVETTPAVPEAATAATEPDPVVRETADAGARRKGTARVGTRPVTTGKIATPPAPTPPPAGEGISKTNPYKH